MPRYIGGPLDGQAGFDPAQDSPEADPSLFGASNMPVGDPALQAGFQTFSAQDAGPPAGGADAGEEEEELSESARFDRMLSDALKLAQGDLTEQNRLLIQKAMTLIQQIKAAEEKESEQAMQGKLSPRLLSAGYAGRSAG